MRNSDPRVRIVSVHRHNSDLNSVLTVCSQHVAISNTVPILVLTWIHPFDCDASSSLGRVYSRLATARNCENYAVSFVMNIVRFQQRSEILHPYNIYSLYLVVTAFQFVIHIVATEFLYTLGHHYPKRLLS